MKFLYKIWSGYDGFQPAVISERRLPGGLLELGWDRYIEAVERGDEVWVYFFGSHSFVNGVYVKGVAHRVDVTDRAVQLRVREFSEEQPLTDAETAARIRQVVRARGRQVFVLPEQLEAAPLCTMTTTATSCAKRQCGSCATWQAMPRVTPNALGRPARLSPDFDAFVPAYWVIARRNFIHQSGRRIRRDIQRTSDLFYRFKVGEPRLAVPLALAMREELAERGLEDFDCVTPVPLSPDKEEAGELHRTRVLANELARLLGIRSRDLLSLSEPTSKRVLRRERGYSAEQFEAAYERRLVVDPAVERIARIALLDDVCTEGSTLSACLARLSEMNPGLEVVAVTAGQMTVKAAVRREQEVVR